METTPMNILLVEDNEGDIELTRIAFRKAGVACDLQVASNGEEAIDLLFKRGKFKSAAIPDLILLDLNMPRMGGREFLDVVKQDSVLKVIPVIMLTSSSAPTDIVECYLRHVNCYILKPSGLESFIDMARQMQNFWMELVQRPRDTLQL